MEYDVFGIFARGARTLVVAGREYGPIQSGAGFSKVNWDTLVQKEPWHPHQARGCTTLITEAVSISLTIAGLPATPLPGHFVAATIATLVSPANRVMAALKAPRTFDAQSASGLTGPVEILDTPPEQMISLVLALSLIHI